MVKQFTRNEFFMLLQARQFKRLHQEYPKLDPREKARLAERVAKKLMRDVNGEVIEIAFVPKNRWEAFKEQWFPGWLQRRFPVSYQD